MGAGAGGPVDVVGSVAESSRASADDPAVSPSRLIVITLTTGSDTNDGTTTATTSHVQEVTLLLASLCPVTGCRTVQLS